MFGEVMRLLRKAVSRPIVESAITPKTPVNDHDSNAIPRGNTSVASDNVPPDKKNSSAEADIHQPIIHAEVNPYLLAKAIVVPAWDSTPTAMHIHPDTSKGDVPSASSTMSPNEDGFVAPDYAKISKVTRLLNEFAQVKDVANKFPERGKDGKPLHAEYANIKDSVGAFNVNYENNDQGQLAYAVKSIPKNQLLDTFDSSVEEKLKKIRKDRYEDTNKTPPESLDKEIQDRKFQSRVLHIIEGKTSSAHLQKVKRAFQHKGFRAMIKKGYEDTKNTVVKQK
jgi:hypothetical protein